MSIDEALKYEAILTEEYDAIPQVLVPEVYIDMEKVLNSVKHIFSGDNIAIEYKIHSPMKSMGYISVTANKLYIKEPKRLSDIISTASNFEIYPKRNGKICAEFTFHGLTKALE